MSLGDTELSSVFVPVPCRGLLWPGAAVLHAGGPGKPERDGYQRQQDPTGLHLLWVFQLNDESWHAEVMIYSLQPKTKCEPHALMHGDEVKMGETVLSFHIHSGTDTCDGCEPGQVMAHLSKHKTEEKPGEAARAQYEDSQRENYCGMKSDCRSFPKGPVLTKEDKETLRQKELKQMKAKYGLQVGVLELASVRFKVLFFSLWTFFVKQSNEEAKTLKNPKYKNRAEFRRQAVGSEGAFQRDDAPASVHE